MNWLQIVHLQLVATTFIPKGTCVLSESPILQIPRSAGSIDAVDRLVTDQINELTPLQRESFLSLSNTHPAKYSHIMGIVKTVSVWFYTDEKGNNLAMSGLRPGQTIAILYAEQHGFLDMSVGIRVEDIHAIQVYDAFSQSVIRTKFSRSSQYLLMCFSR